MGYLLDRPFPLSTCPLISELPQRPFRISPFPHHTPFKSSSPLPSAYPRKTHSWSRITSSLLPLELCPTSCPLSGTPSLTSTSSAWKHPRYLQPHQRLIFISFPRNSVSHGSRAPCGSDLLPARSLHHCSVCLLPALEWCFSEHTKKAMSRQVQGCLFSSTFV